MAYEKLQKYLDKKGLKIKEKQKQKPEKNFNSLSANEKWALVEQLLKDLGYIN